MNSSTEILSMLKVQVRNVHPESKIYLYGSRFRGDAKLDSDWDILNLLNTNEVSKELEKAILDKLFNLELKTGQVISPMLYT
jgi:predicted nucleotidyltransferase